MATLTPHTDDDPSPRVDVLFSSGDLTAGTDTIMVIQTSSDGEVIVRNGERIGAVGGATITDYEVPLGVSVSYRAEQFNSSGVSLGLTSTTSTQVDIPAGYVIFQDPLAPGSAVRVRAEFGFAETLERQRDVQVYRRGLQTVALMGELGLLENVSLRVITESLPDAVMLDQVLAEGTIVVRSMPPMPVPRVLHAVVGSPRRIPANARSGGDVNVYDLTGVEVSRTSLDIIVPVITWQDYIDFYSGGTWQDMVDDYTTWLDAKLNPPPSA